MPAELTITQLTEWMEAFAKEVRRDELLFKAIRDQRGGAAADDDPVLNYALGRFQGKREALNAVSAFLTLAIEDGAGHLSPDLLR